MNLSYYNIYIYMLDTARIPVRAHESTDPRQKTMPRRGNPTEAQLRRWSSSHIFVRICFNTHPESQPIEHSYQLPHRSLCQCRNAMMIAGGERKRVHEEGSIKKAEGEGHHDSKERAFDYLFISTSISLRQTT